MPGKNGHEAVTEAATYLLPKDPLQSAVHRPVNKAQSAEEGGEYPTPPSRPAAEVAPPTPLEQGLAALFYAAASLLVIFVNKVRVRVGPVLRRMGQRAREALACLSCSSTRTAVA